MKQSDHHNTDYLEGTVNFAMEVHKQDDGTTKASCMGWEVSHLDEQTAVLRLQDNLQEALLNGQLRPDM